jgi:hypothetical protein
MEKQTFNLGQLGTVQLKKPDLLGISFEFTSLWASDLDQAQLARLCSAAICVSVDDNRIPVYRPEKGGVLEYGFRSMDRLLKLGVSPNRIYEAGAIALLQMADSLPSENEVKEQVNFTTDQEPGD